MNSARHFFIERNVDRAEKADHEQTEFAEAFPQPESDVTELHRHNLPRQRHPHRRSPDHRATADRVIESMRVIDQPSLAASSVNPTTSPKRRNRASNASGLRTTKPTS